MSTVIESPRTVPFVEQLTGLTAWDACQRLADRSGLLFLDSVQPAHPRPLFPGGERGELGRYSYVSAEPAVWLTSNHGWINENGRFVAVADPLTMLAHRLAEF